MDIRKKKNKGNLLQSIFIILFVILLCALSFLIQHNKVIRENTNYFAIVPLSDDEPEINTPTLQVGAARFLTLTENEPTKLYSDLTSSPDDTTLKATITSTDTSVVVNTGASNKNSKYMYFDFSMLLDVPAYTEYTVKYKVTFSVYKNASNGNATGFANFYDYGGEELEDNVYRNAENLYKSGVDLEFYENDYFVGRASGNGCKTTYSNTYECNLTYTNKTEDDKEFTQCFGSYSYVNRGTTYSSALRNTVSIVASIEARSLKTPCPKDVEIVYTGQELSLADIEDSAKTWYDVGIMALDYSENTDMINAGEKRVKVTLTQADDIFAGTPAEGEDKQTRYFTFSILKKKIGIDISEASGGLEVTPKTGAVYSGDTKENGRAPTFSITYKNNSSGVSSTTYPTTVGTYTATVNISNECNYELDGTYTQEITVTAKDVAKPSVGLTTLPYNGEEQYFTVSGVSSDVKITPVTNGFRYEDGKLYAKDYGTYKATVSLADEGKSTQWTGGGTAAYDITITISKATLTVTFNSVGGWSWNSNTEKEITITDNRKKEEEQLSFSVSYDTTQINNVSTNGKITTVTVPKLPVKDGGYTLSVTLNDTGDGKNYTLGGVTTQRFNITDREITVTDSNIIWSYSNGSDSKELESWSESEVYKITYNGKEYEFSAKVSGLAEEDEVVIDKYTTTQSGTNAGEYTTTVMLTSSKGKLTKSSFTLKWKIEQALLNLTNVKWNYESAYEYNSAFYEVKLMNLPEGVNIEYEDNRKMNVGEYTAIVNELTLADSMTGNYIRPNINDKTTYIGEVEWTLEWEIKKAVLDLSWTKKTYDDKNSRKIRAYEVSNANASGKIEYRYYKEEDYVNGEVIGEDVEFSTLVVEPGIEVKYWVVAVLKNEYLNNYEIKTGTQYKRFTVGSQAPIRNIEIESKFVYDGNTHGGKEEWKVNDSDHIVAEYYSIDGEGQETLLDSVPTNAGKYVIKLDIEDGYEETFELSEYKLTFEITKAQIKAVWNTSGSTPVLEGISANDSNAIEYEYTDGEGNVIEKGNLESGKTYKVVAKIKSEYAANYEFVDVQGVVLTQPTVTEEQEFEVKGEVIDPTDPTTPVDPTDPTDPNNPNSPSEPSNNINLDNIGDAIKQYWQPILTLVSIILILIFTSKGIGYASKRKKTKKSIEKKYSTFYAISGVGLFKIPNMTWTVVASIMAGVAVLSIVFMLLEKRSYSKVEEELDEAKEDYDRNQKELENKRRDDQMQMMLMSIMGGNNGNDQQGYSFVQQPALGADEIRGIVSETMTALLPGMQQMLPQQASNNDDIVQKLMEQNAHNEEVIKNLAAGQEKLMQKLAEKPTEKVVEREVATSNVSEEILEKLASKLQSTNGNDTILRVVEKTEHNDETIKQLLKNQEKLMEKILELSNEKSQPQVVEKIVEKEVPVEKIVEKEVRVEVPVEVEKVVEKEVVKEVPIEKIVEVPVEKVVEKEVVKEVKVEVPVVVPTPAKPKKEVAPRLTLDEAYAQLSKQQQKYFDGLREYALTKDKCREKKSTYFVVFGQSTINPLMKLTIKKGKTVALFKMEDEYMKDIRRDATSDGTKVKVKETEVIIADAQSCKVAKNMIDLREDQIERYQDLLKEQRAVSKKRK